MCISVTILVELMLVFLTTGVSTFVLLFFKIQLL
jgi:hypothetical protein